MPVSSFLNMLHQIIGFFFNIAMDLVAKMGYFGIFLGMTIESACIPLPSEAIMGFAGFLVHKGQFNLWVAALCGALGNITGSTIMYLLGKYGGHPFVAKYGKWIRVSHNEIHRAEKWFAKYGDITVFIAQVLPVVRTFVSFPAGLLEINYKKFIFYTFTGAFIWCFALAYFGMVLGENWEKITEFLKPVQDIAIVFVAALFVYFVYSHFFKKRGSKHSQQ